MAESGAFWQGGLSLEAESAFAMAFLRPWLGWYDGGPAFEAAAGAGIGHPIPWISGHAWAGAMSW